MKSPLIIALSTLVAGFAGGLIFNQYIDDPEPTNSPVVQNLNTTAIRKSDPSQADSGSILDNLNTLKRQLEDEIDQRKLLQQQIDDLTHQVAALDQNLQLNKTSSDKKNIKPESSAEIWFNEQALIDSGMNSSQTVELKTFFEQQELDRMYLRDQAFRESWDRQRYRDEIEKLSLRGDSFLSQLDETAYDAYLYASQQPNRVKVTNVLESSQAGTAGIKPGDHILRYDNERIYSGFELRTATTAGNIDDSIAVEIERDGEILEVYLARGPLGIRMDSVSVAPTR